MLVFLSSPAAVTSPADVVAWPWYDVARVSGKVASQTSSWPQDYGTMLMPLGRLPSDLNKSAGSSCNGILAVTRALWMMEFTVPCL